MLTSHLSQLPDLRRGSHGDAGVRKRRVASTHLEHHTVQQLHLIKHIYNYINYDIVIYQE